MTKVTGPRHNRRAWSPSTRSERYCRKDRGIRNSHRAIAVLPPRLGAYRLPSFTTKASQTGALLPAPGEPWKWPRGDEVWILSAAHRRLKRHSEPVGSVERYGLRVERRLANDWLKIRPEGGGVISMETATRALSEPMAN